MDWAPVLSLNPAVGDETGKLKISDNNNVEWIKNNSIYRVYEMEQPVRAAIFANYAHEDPEELWVVVVLEDQTVHSFATSKGQRKIMGLNFSPRSILRCGKIGVAFTAAVGSHLNIYVLQGPEELLQAVVPSSMMEPLNSEEKLVYIDDNAAVIWSATLEMVKAYSVRLLQHKYRLTSAGSDVSTHILSNGMGGHIAAFSSARPGIGSTLSPVEPKAAVLSLLRKWKQKSIGSVFTQELDTQNHEPSNWLAALHDPVSQCLFVLSGIDLVSHDNIQHVTPMKGIHGIPVAVLAIDGWLHLRSLFFPNSAPLGFPFIAQESQIAEIRALQSEPDKNWVDISFSGDDLAPQRIALFDDIVPEILTCLDIFRELVGFKGMSLLIREFLLQIRLAESNWLAFRRAFVKSVSGFSANVVSELIFNLHMLREELGLLEMQADAKSELELLIAPFVQDWSEEWRITYPLDQNSQSNLQGVAVPIDVNPPCVLESLIHNFDSSIGQPFPDLSLSEEFYPYSCLMNRIFQLISAVPWSASAGDEISRLITKNNLVDNLEQFDFSIQACLLQVIQLINSGSGKSDTLGTSETDDDIGFEGPTPQNLFYKDLRFEEAMRCLQTKEPQQCLYGILVDPDKISADKIMEIQPRWSKALSGRALATAYGRAAMDLGKITPLLWDQIVAPSIDFSGVCTETGISIPATYKTFQEAAKGDPWGAFAHGAALGISVARSSKGVDSLWVMTSAKLKAESKEMYSGFIYGMGMSGHLNSLEDWRFYENLVNSDKYGTLAALIGVAASKLGSRDAKLTKVFSVHIRALLPKEMDEQHFVATDIENGALAALGLLYFGTGIRHISHKLKRHLEYMKESSTHIYDGNGMESNEVYKFALGLSLGLINCGCGSVNDLDSLVNIIMTPHDENVSASERVPGALVALICGYIGTNDERVASAIDYTPSNIAASYLSPAMFFGRALAYHLIMWDSVGTTPQWVDEACKAFGSRDTNKASISSSAVGTDQLNYLYWKAGTLVAMAMRHAGSNNEEVINTVCGQLETIYLPLYISNISRLIRCRSQDSRFRQEYDPNFDERLSAKDQFHFDYLSTLFTRGLARMVGHLVLAVSAVAAGTGNLRIMRLLRQLWQVNPQFQAFASYDDPQSNENHIQNSIEQSLPSVNIDLSLIAQSFGWLFMASGRSSFKTDCASVALLTCSSFIQILGGANLDPYQWRYLRFLWSLVTEQRCLFSASNPADAIKVEVKRTASFEVISTAMPILLPPLSDIEYVKIVDTKVMSVTLSNLSESKISRGVRLTPCVNHAVGLGAMLKKQQLMREPMQQQLSGRYDHLSKEEKWRVRDNNAHNEMDVSVERDGRRAAAAGTITNTTTNVMAATSAPMDGTSRSITESTVPLRKVLESMARHPKSYQDQLELTLLLSFYRHIRPSKSVAGVFSDQWLEQTQLKSWLSQQSL